MKEFFKEYFSLTFLATLIRVFVAPMSTPTKTLEACVKCDVGQEERRVKKWRRRLPKVGPRNTFH